MPFVPDEYAPPRIYRSDAFVLKVLSPRFASEDFVAVTRSADNIRHVFGPTNGWPDRLITFEENLADLERHDREFSERVAFAYAILSPDGQGQ